MGSKSESNTTCSPLPAADPEIVPESLLQDMSEDIKGIYVENWWQIRNYTKNGGGLCSEYNIRLTTIKPECLSQYIAAIRKMQKQVFKLNIGFGFILRHIETNEFKYFYACRNNF